jgi:hypothetical protein
MTDLAVTEQPSEHGKRARGENIVDEWFLPVKRFRRGAARQRIFTALHVDDGWEELGHTA